MKINETLLTKVLAFLKTLLTKVLAILKTLLTKVFIKTKYKIHTIDPKTVAGTANNDYFSSIGDRIINTTPYYILIDHEIINNNIIII